MLADLRLAFYHLMSLPIVYHPDFVTPLPPEHRFPMPKFGKVYEVLLRDGVAGLEQFHLPEIAGRDWLELVHTPALCRGLSHRGSIDAKAMRRIGFPWSPALVTRTCTAVGGTGPDRAVGLAPWPGLQHGRRHSPCAS